MKNYTIRTEQPRDFKTVENLTREAFWNVYRPGCTEHYVLHCYRSEPDFVVASTRGIRYADDPESDAPYFLCKELQEGFLDGITGSYRDPEPYFVAMRNPEAFEKYDAEFPPKEKLVLPGQLG